MKKAFVLTALLALMLIAPPQGSAQSAGTFDALKWKMLVNSHLEFYLGKLPPSSDGWRRLDNAEYLFNPKAGDLFGWYYINLRKPFGDTDGSEKSLNDLRDKVKSLPASFEGHLKKLSELKGAVSDCQRQLETTRKDLAPDPSLKKSDADKALKERFKAYGDIKLKPFIVLAQPASGRQVALGEGTQSAKTVEDEFNFLIKKLLKAAKAREPLAVALCLDELDSALKRISWLDGWMELQTRWMIDSAKLCSEDLKKVSSGDNGFQGRNLDGGYALMYRYEDIAEIQRQVDDMLFASQDDRSKLNTRSYSGPQLLVAPGCRGFYVELLDACGNAPEITALMEKSLLNEYDNAYLNHILWKYKGKGVTKNLADVIAKWKALRKDDIASNQARLGFLEVIDYKQGSMEASPLVTDRFHPRIIEAMTRLEGDKQRQFEIAEGIFAEWYKGMKYGGTLTIEDTFRTNIADCYKAGSITAFLMANNGHDGLYPLRSSTNHVMVACRVGGRYICRDPLFPMGESEFPSEDRGSVNIYTERYSRWVRTISTYIDADILMGGSMGMKDGRMEIIPPDIVRREIPYYGQKEGRVKLEFK